MDRWMDGGRDGNLDPYCHTLLQAGVTNKKNLMIWPIIILHEEMHACVKVQNFQNPELKNSNF